MTCQALVLRLLVLPTGSGPPAVAVLCSKKQGSELPETHCDHFLINLPFCCSRHLIKRKNYMLLPQSSQIKGQSTLFKKTEELHTCTTNKWHMQNRPTEETASVKLNQRMNLLFDWNRTLFRRLWEAGRGSSQQSEQDWNGLSLTRVLSAFRYRFHLAPSDEDKRRCLYTTPANHSHQLCGVPPSRKIPFHG